MKVRHKATGIELEVRKPFTSTLYYYTTGGSLIHRGDPDWQLVPEEEWKDITKECELGTYSGFTSDTTLILKGKQYIHHEGYVFNGSSEYRLRKIDGLHHGPAFIVERRKES